MAIWNKKEVSKEVVKSIHQQYGCDLLTASIFARRGITSGEDIFYFPYWKYARRQETR